MSNGSQLRKKSILASMGNKVREDGPRHLKQRIGIGLKMDFDGNWST